MRDDKVPPLLIVEDDLALQKQLKWSFDRFDSVVAHDRESALLQCRRYQPAVVTMDLGLPPARDSVSEGFRLLEELLALDPSIKVVVLTGQNDQANALRAVALGAYDFFAKPFDPDLLGLTLDRAYRLAALQAENRRLQASHRPDAFGSFMTGDPTMLRICRTVEKISRSDASVLFLGESGTGKEVLAQGLHEASKRRGRFVAINCAAIPENLLESELFGYERGAFTGAARTTPGRHETADGGTLMLDEIGDLPLALQAKLLRFLQERKIERLGGRQEIDVDVRIACATHQNLQERIRDGRFREDLYYRIAEITVEIPPLRARNGDAAVLAHAFLRRYADEQRRGSLGFSEEAIRAIEAHPWPGNVRQLQSAVKRAAIMADGTRVVPSDLGLAGPETDGADGGLLDLRTVRDGAERQAVVAALARVNGNVLKASAVLGISRPTLYDLMHRLAIKP